LPFKYTQQAVHDSSLVSFDYVASTAHCWNVLAMQRELLSTTIESETDPGREKPRNFIDPCNPDFLKVMLAFFSGRMWKFGAPAGK